MTDRSSLSNRLPIALAALLLPACSAGADRGSDDADVEAATSDIRASCTNPRRYFVTLADGVACEPIAGRRGRWVPETDPVFGDAPPEVRVSTCVMAWAGDPRAPADREALVATIGERNAAAAACGA